MIFPLQDTISRDQRISAMKQQPFVIWLTGLSGSGKSTLATALEKKLIEKNFKAYLLDGDTVRAGLNKDLGFSEADRRENIRRIGEVCKLMNDAGLIVITAFISPFRAERDFVRSLLPSEDFAEVYLNSSLESCEARDVKGLYGKARKGIISDFTGIDSPYEQPLNPELILNTDRESEHESLTKLLNFLLPKISMQDYQI
jgi:adenylyl-sulfate kinase